MLITIANFISVTGLLVILFIAIFFHYLFHILLSLSSSSAGLGFLPVGLTQTLIPEDHGPLKVLPELGCCGFH